MGIKVIRQKACVYAYGIRQEKAILIENLCKSQNLSYQVIREEDRQETIGFIAGYTGFEKKKEVQKSESAQKSPEVLLFSALSEEQLDHFLEGYRNMGIEPVGLKAVVTKHNEQWTLDELIQELIRERAAMLLGQMKKDR